MIFFSRHEIGDIWDFLSCALFLSRLVLVLAQLAGLVIAKGLAAILAAV
jgi:hypothetical protein